jgi:hypothetical protein
VRQKPPVRKQDKSQQLDIIPARRKKKARHVEKKGHMEVAVAVERRKI